MNPLDDNPTLRKRAYRAMWLIALTIGAIQVAYATLEIPAPAWLRVTLAVFTFVAAAVGYTADRNTPPARS